MSFIGRTLKVAVAAPIGWVAYSRFVVDHHRQLPDAIDADRHTMRTAAAGTLSYYADESGDGRPVVLLHSVNAAASAREMRSLFQHYSGNRPVYALDLPGFGFSDRVDRHYSPQMYADAIGEFLIHGLHEAPDVIALSLSCEFAALASSVNPDMVHSLVFISPTGLTVDHDAKSIGPKVTITPLHTSFSLGLRPLLSRVRPEQIHKVIANRFIAQPLFDLVASKPSIWYFSPRSERQGGLTGDGVDYSYRTSHRPGAKNAPLYFVSRGLYTDDIDEVYRDLPVPTLVLHGEARYVNFDRLPDVLAANDRWKAVGIDTAGEMVHDDEPHMTTRTIEDFWSDMSSAATADS